MTRTVEGVRTQKRPEIGAKGGRALLIASLGIALLSLAFLVVYEVEAGVGHLDLAPTSGGEAVTTVDTLSAVGSIPVVTGVENLDKLPVVWLETNQVEAAENGCYKTTTVTGWDRPKVLQTTETPASVPPPLEKPVGTIERGAACGRGSLAWRIRTGDAVSSSAALYEVAGSEVAVIGSRDGTVYALNTSDGRVVWKSEGHEGVDTIPFIEDGTVYFGTEKGEMVALGVSDGHELWRTKSQSKGLFQSSPTVYKDMVISGGTGNLVQAWEKTTGKLRWTYHTDLWVQSSVAIKDGVGYVGSDDGWLHAFDADSGKLRWRFAADLPQATEHGEDVDLRITPDGRRSNVLSTPRFFENLAIVTSVGGEVHAVDTKTGTSKWRQTVERSVTDTTVHEGVVYVHTDAGILRALDAATGQILWASRTATSKNTWTGPYQTGSAAAIYGEDVLVGGRDGDLTAFDRSTGAYKWSFRAGRWIQSTPRVAGDVAIFGSDDGWIYAVRLN